MDYGSILGTSPLGVPAFSNGPDPLLTHSNAAATPIKSSLKTGGKWNSVEFARRYLLASKGCYLPAVTIAESVWSLDRVIHNVARKSVPFHAYPNGSLGMSSCPLRGDILVWKRTPKMPFGHVAVVTEVTRHYVRIAEQGWDNQPWVSEEGASRNFSRQLQMTIHDSIGTRVQSQVVDDAPNPYSAASIIEDANSAKETAVFHTKRFELFDDTTALLGWMRVDMVDMDAEKTDWMDDYRLSGSSLGSLLRHQIPADLHDHSRSLPWLTSEAADAHIRRSLLRAGAEDPEAAEASGLAPLAEVPSGWYEMDYDLWMRLKVGSREVHKIALEACNFVLNHGNAQRILEDQFGIPKELHKHLRASFSTSPCLGGRFDYGLDAEGKLKIFEYNSDSSAALIECGDTQGKWSTYMAELKTFSQHHTSSLANTTTDEQPSSCDGDAVEVPVPETIRSGARRGQHTGQHLFPRMVKAWMTFKNRDFFCPSQHWNRIPGVAPKTVHFMVDDDDEEKYTALYMMKAAQTAGFRTKLVVGQEGFSYDKNGFLLDESGTSVQCIWKTWSWDTVLRDFENCGKIIPTREQAKLLFDRGDSVPSLSQILLRDDICVIEPMWKLVVGNKALLSFMHQVSPAHPNLLTTTFTLTPDLVRQGYVSKPVSGRAGQNITLHPADPKKAAAMDGRGMDVTRTPTSTLSARSTRVNGSFAEETGGRFYDSVQVFQEKLKIQTFDGNFPILCAWMIGDDFAGVVVREDTSQITKLGSIVAPARVVRF